MALCGRRFCRGGWIPDIDHEFLEGIRDLGKDFRARRINPVISDSANCEWAGRPGNVNHKDWPGLAGADMAAISRKKQTTGHARP